MLGRLGEKKKGGGEVPRRRTCPSRSEPCHLVAGVPLTRLFAFVVVVALVGVSLARPPVESRWDVEAPCRAVRGSVCRRLFRPSSGSWWDWSLPGVGRVGSSSSETRSLIVRLECKLSQRVYCNCLGEMASTVGRVVQSFACVGWVR